MLGVYLLNLDADSTDVGGEGQVISSDDTTPLHAFRQLFIDLSTESCSDDVWTRFVALVDEMTVESVIIVKLPVRSEG